MLPLLPLLGLQQVLVYRLPTQYDLRFTS